MQTIMSVSLAPETLQAFDSWRAQRGLARGKAIQELLNLAAAWERSGALAGDGAIDDGPALARLVARETSTTRVVSPAVLGSESEKQRRLAAAMSLHPSIRQGLGQPEPTFEPLGPGERRVDPFEEDAR